MRQLLEMERVDSLVSVNAKGTGCGDPHSLLKDLNSTASSSDEA